MFLDDSSSARYLSTTLGCSFADCRLAVAEVTGAPGRTPMRTPLRSPLISWAVQAHVGHVHKLEISVEAPIRKNFATLDGFETRCHVTSP